MKNTFLLCWALLAVMVSQAQIIHVHPDSAYSTIQAGINAANPGDTVLVGDAVYYEQISFMGKKPLMVASYYLMDGDTNHIANTIIDGDSITDTDNGSIVNFKSGEDSTSVLMGFTIRNGNTGTLRFLDVFKVRCGGAIYFNISGGKIVHNHITQNHLDDVTLPGNPYTVAGGGVFSSWTEWGPWIVVADNVIDSNSVNSKSLQACGGGISISYQTVIRNNIIKDNNAIGNGSASAIGAGLGCFTGVGSTVLLEGIVKGNTITNNQSVSGQSSANSAGVLLQEYKCTFTGNTVTDNYVSALPANSGPAGVRLLNPTNGSIVSGNFFRNNITLGRGGGLCVEYPDANSDTAGAMIGNNTFILNSAGKGGGLYIENLPVAVQNNVFADNQANEGGGAIYAINHDIDVPHMVTIINSSFSRNVSKTYGGAFYSDNEDPLVFNSVFWKDSTYYGLGHEIYLYENTDTLEIAYSNIHNAGIQGIHVFGDGMIDEDPLFTSSDSLTIDWGSPCYQAGTGNYTCQCGILHNSPSFDILGWPRPQQGFYEMGAYEVLPAGIDTKWQSNNNLTCSVQPNPFTGSVTLTYVITAPCQVNVSIYNVVGQEVDNPLNGYFLNGEFKTKISMESLPAGLYLYRITAGNKTGSGTLVKH